MVNTHLVVITTNKLAALTALSAGTVFAAEIAEPALMPWATLGVGGILAGTILYFYVQLAAASRKREQEVALREALTADAYRVQAALMITTLQANSAATTLLSAAVSELRTVVSDSSREQRERYEAELRAGGRRNYDPPLRP